MKSWLWKLCSMVLVFVMLINLLPVQAIALPWSSSDADEATASGGELTAEETVMGDVAVVSEVTDKRTEFSKEYKLSNGLHLAVVYPEAVHYEDNGQWKDIDSTLQAVGSGTNGTYTNRAGAWNVVFPQRLNRNRQVSVALDGHTVSIGIAGELRANSLYANESTLAAASSSGNMAFTVAEMQTADAQICELDYTLAKESAEYPETVRDKLQSRLVYSDVFENTDILYDLKNDRLKESVVIRQYDDALLGYRYTLDTGTLVPVLNGDGSVDLTEPDSGRILMTMPAPYMIDNAGTVSYDVTVSLVPNGSAYILTYQMPMEWLGDSERAWPVVLDPSITASSARQNVRDQFVAEDYYEDNNHGALYCGYYTYFGKMRTFIKYATIPELQSSDVIINASLSLVYLGGTSGTTTVEAHKVNGTWASETITWDTQPGYNANVEDYANVSGSGRYEWTITDVVRDWYTGENTGVMLKATDSVESGSSVNWKKFYSIDYDMYSPELWPYLSITFRNSNGLESYWDYTSGSAGRAGTGYVNNYSGNLTWVHGDIGFGGNRMPVSISHIYNVSDSTANTYGMGYGWKTNFNQTVSVWDQDSNYYVWEDGDGTRHYFLLQSDGSYQDEDGLELTLTTTGSGTTKYKIADKYGNASYFDTSGRLTKMENNQETKSSILITYQSSGSKLISKITDGAGRVYNFTYTNGLLNRISYVGKGTTEIAYVSYGYTSSRLTSVTDMDGKSCLYTYDSANHLTSAQDIDGYKLQYTYCTGSPKRVVGISEYDGTTAGGTLTIEYAHNQTTFTDHNGNIQITQFNIFGNAVSVQDGQGRAQYVKYARNDDKDTTGKGNQLTLSSKMQNTVSNLLSDGSFELGNSWAVNADTITMSRTTATSYLGNYSLKAASTADGETNGVHSPYVYVAPGETITFSAYVKSSGTPIRLAFHCLYEGYNFLVSGEEIQPSEEWTRTEVSYTNEEDITLRLVGYLFNKTAGVSYIDCAQVELQPTASRYNLIENGDFNGTTGWSSSSGRTTLSDIAAPQLDGNVYRMTGSPTSARSISQTVNVSGGEGDTYVFGGWAKGNSVPLKDENRTFGMELTFHYTDGTTSEETVSFNTACDSRDSWQYVSAPAVAERAYSSITVRLTYDYNANTVYFDGIQLFREEFGTSYGYDENGNLTSVVDLQKQRTDYKYTNNNLTQILQDNKAKVTYTYDAYHNVKTATTQEGIVYSFDYDTYGNNTSVSIGSGSVQITATATYSTDGNILLSTKDALDKVTTYGYNINTNVLEWVQYPEDTDATRTEYSYDTMYRLASAAANTDSGLSLTADYTYTDDLLTAIETPSTTYSFVYGDFAQRSSVKVGTRTLASYTYTNDQNRWLDTMTYGNGDSVSYTYDDYGRVLSETFEDGATVTYQYDNTGALAIVRDSETGIKTTYYYDFTDRLMKYVESGSDYSHSVGYEFDTLNNLTRLVETINGVKHTTTYTYDEDNRLEQTVGDNIIQTYTYDAWGRMYESDARYSGTGGVTKSYFYTTPSSGHTSSHIYNYQADTPEFTVNFDLAYDDNGNITSVEYGTTCLSYAYDSANQLIRENNSLLGKTWVWAYDNAGNILSRTEYAYTTEPMEDLDNPTSTVSYVYGSSLWGDLLTKYNGIGIHYDAIGNPRADGTWTYTWQHGRELASMSDGETTWTYTYDANGMRTSRTDGTTTYSYIYNGGKLIQMTRGTDTLEFYYDAVGAPVIVKYNGEVYNYVTTLQGDVMLILDTDGEIVVEYTYDAWGGHMTVGGSMASTLGAVNPLTYRGYVYDTETGLYYLQSRYYNPEIGRFINADNYPTTGQGLTGNNMFAYCGNNPVNRKDDGGEFWHLIVGAIVGAATQYISDVVTNLAEGKSFSESLKPCSTLADYGSAALSGALAASGVGYGVSVVANAALGGATYLANCAIKGEDANMLDFGLATGVGAVSGLVGGSGADGAKLRGVAKTSKQVLKSTVSPKKIAMYTAKKVAVRQVVVTSTARTMAAGFVSNFLNYQRKEYTASFA